MSKDNKYDIEQPLANRVYGNIIYTISIIAAIICIVAPVLAVAFSHRNVLDPQFVFSTIWKGANPAAVWQKAGGGFPGGHFWVNHLFSGDGIIQFGIELAGSCAGIALFGASFCFLKQKPRNWVWAALSWLICIMILLAAIGVYKQPAG